MRTKDEILSQFESAYTPKKDFDERIVLISNFLLEALLDIRDLLKDLDTQVIKLNAKW